MLSGLALPDRDFSGGATFGLLNLQTFHDLVGREFFFFNRSLVEKTSAYLRFGNLILH